MRIGIYGAGGFGKEVRGMIESQPAGAQFIGYWDDFKTVSPEVIGDEYDDVVIAIADPHVRQKLVKNWNRKPVPFNSWISNDFVIHPSVSVGRGCVICPGVKLTVDVAVGRFVIINLNSTVGHDVSIGDFTSLMPSVNISGNVNIGKRVFIGSGATILQGLTIGDDVVIGAGAVVTKSIAAGQRVKGVPAKPW